MQQNKNFTMDGKILVAAGAAAYMLYKQNKESKKTIDDLKNELDNTSAYMQSQIDDITNTSDLNNFVKPNSFNLKVRSIVNNKWGYELNISVTNTSKSSVKLQDFNTIVYCEDGQTKNFVLDKQIPIAAGETKTITVGGGTAEIFPLKETRERIRKRIAEMCGKKLFTSAASLQKAKYKTLTASATTTWNFGGDTTNFNEKGKIFNIAGTLTYMGATGGYSRVGQVG